MNDHWAFETYRKYVFESFRVETSAGKLFQMEHISLWIDGQGDTRYACDLFFQGYINAIKSVDLGESYKKRDSGDIQFEHRAGVVSDVEIFIIPSFFLLLAKINLG